VFFYTDICFTFELLRSIVLFICLAINSSQKCLRISKTESYGLSRICFEMTRQATMPLSSQKCPRVSKTESYGLSRICFEMTRQATMPSSSQKCLCVSKTESYGLSRICFEMTRQATMPSSKAGLVLQMNNTSVD
jgi:prolipoprotein diacylglyceryltransferase